MRTELREIMIRSKITIKKSWVMREIFFLALPGLTGLDERRPVTRVTGVALLHGCTANELIGLVG